MGLIYQAQPVQPFQAYSEIMSLSTGMYSNLKTAHTNIFNLIWNSPYGITTQQIFDQYGVNASGLFQISSDIQYVLYETDPTYVPLSVPSGVLVTINPDCTITIDPSGYPFN